MAFSTKLIGLSVLTAAIAGAIASGWGMGLNDARKDSNEYRAAMIALYVTTSVIGLSIVVLLFTC